MLDKHGNEVKIGDVVRVLEIYEGFLDTLPADEKPYIKGMLGHEFSIEGFPEENKASISIEWKFENGDMGFGGLYMLGNEFELVRRS